MFPFCSRLAVDGGLCMVQAIRSFAEGLRRRLGIIVSCPRCGRDVIYRCEDFRGWISGAADIEELNWRCRSCGRRADYVRYLILERMIAREDIVQWTPPRRRKPPHAM